MLLSWPSGLIQVHAVLQMRTLPYSMHAELDPAGLRERGTVAAGDEVR